MSFIHLGRNEAYKKEEKKIDRIQRAMTELERLNESADDVQPQNPQEIFQWMIAALP